MIQSGKLQDARMLFDKLPQRNTVTWNSMLTGYAQNQDIARARKLFEEIPERDVNCRIWSEGKGGGCSFYFNLIPPCSSKANGRRVGIEKNVVSWTSMIMCYVKAGDMTRAKDLFDQMENRDTFTWNTMISGYVHVLAMEEATDLFSKMPAPDALSWNSIIWGFAQLGKMELALDFFERMPNKNKVSWNTIISGFEKNAEYKETIDHFGQMQSVGEKPDRFTLSSLLSVCAESVAQTLGIQIHQLVTKFVIPDIPLNNALITMYARCGAVFEAKKVFKDIKFQKNVISWK